MAKSDDKTEVQPTPEAPAQPRKSVYEIFGTNKDEEQAGIWLDYGPFRFLLARAGGANRRYAACVERKLRPHRAAINSGALDEELGATLLAEAYAETIVLGWEGIEDETGKPMTFNKKNVVKLLTDLPDLFQALRAEAENRANFVQAGASEDAKS